MALFPYIKPFNSDSFIFVRLLNLCALYSVSMKVISKSSILMTNVFYEVRITPSGRSARFMKWEITVGSMACIHV
jgi:hypothetical protein